jgi:transcriptional regulator with XRE-family HTH domain
MSKRTDFFMEGKELLAKPFHYSASGLNNIYLLNGVTEETTDYGKMVHIENINGLHHAIGLHIIEKDEPMEGAEFRFLRKQMGLSQAQLADGLNVTDQTIANYEKGKTALGPAEAFIKTSYLLFILPEQTRVEVLKSMMPPVPKKQKRLPDVPRRKLVERWVEDVMPQAA